MTTTVQARYESYQLRRELIIGGHNIERGRYPYFVSLDKNNGVIVNGALIAPDIVLSAGHIVLDHMDNLTLKIGPYAVHQKEIFAEDAELREWLIPDTWSQGPSGFFHDDLMIMKLAKPSKHQPIKINMDPKVPFAGQRVIMTGLGWLNESFVSPASIVQEVELLTVDNEQCRASEDRERKLNYNNIVDGTMLCTKAPPNTTRDGCAWDSGAPVIVRGLHSSQDLLVGLGSAGVGCADATFPSIQARVSEGFLWIREKVCLLSIDPPAYFTCQSSPSLVDETENQVESNSAAAMLVRNSEAHGLRFPFLGTPMFHHLLVILVSCCLAMSFVLSSIVGNSRIHSRRRNSSDTSSIHQSIDSSNYGAIGSQRMA